MFSDGLCPTFSFNIPHCGLKVKRTCVHFNKKIRGFIALAAYTLLKCIGVKVIVREIIHKSIKNGQRTTGVGLWVSTWN